MSALTSSISGTLTPFLYPSLVKQGLRVFPFCLQRSFCISKSRSYNSPTLDEDSEDTGGSFSRLNPPPSDYSRQAFTDRATVILHAGNGGHGCISFLREKYISAGPANGGDGGYGGGIYIQAVRGETSLHQIARRRIIKAGRGKNGQGSSRGGERGEDVVLQVPVGTVVREIDRVDPISIEEEKLRLEGAKEDSDPLVESGGPYKWSRDKWLLYPAITPEDIASAEFPQFPRARRSHLSAAQVQAPIQLDLSKPMDKPLLLAAGAVGGLGNPHFVTTSATRPKFATKGEYGLRITLELELKLLADVGLVGLPNAGKSTLLRAMTNSRARIGDWAFTTLQPNIGTVVLDDHHGRPGELPTYEDGEPRPNFTIADIPGLVQDAHLDRGLGISFLRHVERARVLAFVIDLSAGDAVTALKALWKEVGEYERMKFQEEKEKKEQLIHWSPFPLTDNEPAHNGAVNINPGYKSEFTPKTFATPIAGKPWFVIASKADLPGTHENYQLLKSYLDQVEKGHEAHPSGHTYGWSDKLEAIPVSAINGHGVDRITKWTISLLDT